MEHSSVKITFSKLSSLFALHRSSLLTLFTSRINWQYALPLKVQPKLERQRRMVTNESCIPLSLKSFNNWTDVVSSSLTIWASTRALMVGVIFEGLPDPTRLAVVPVSFSFLRSIRTPCLVTRIPSLASIWVILAGLSLHCPSSIIHCRVYSS